MNKCSVFSIYMSNISVEVRNAQKSCVENFLPTGWKFMQHLTTKSHPAGIMECIEQAETDGIFLLDIDAIPLTSGALEYVALAAEKGSLSGCVQRSNHINNNNHLYAGPFCMAFSKQRYRGLGSPSFVETMRGDVGEELTYAWQKDDPTKIKFLWPSHVEQPLWDLDGSSKFGFGTTYEGLFYHAFNARAVGMKQRFIEKCNLILSDGVPA